MIRTRRWWVIAAIGLCTGSTAFADAGCRKSAQRQAQAPMAGITTLIIEAGVGELQVRGDSSESMLRVNARACASSDQVLEEAQIEITREADTLILRTRLPANNHYALGWFGPYASLDLTVAVPSSAALRIEKTNGPTDIRNVGSLTIEAKTGSLSISGVGGEVTARHSGGQVLISDLRDNLTLSDGFGQAVISRVWGNVHVTEDTQGQLVITNVRGNVDIDQDGSGEIQIHQVRGQVRIGNDTEGKIVVGKVRGDVLVEAQGKGDLLVEDIRGALTVLNHAKGQIRHTAVEGEVHLP